MSSVVLYVVRSRLHLQDKIRLEKSYSCIVTASDFFDQIRLATFISHVEVHGDDAALSLVAADILTKESSQEFVLAPHYTQLFREVLQGGVSVSEILRKLEKSADLYPVFSRLNKIALRMRNLGKIDKETALFDALEILRKKKQLPDFLQKFSSVTFEGIDLTLLEQEVIAQLEKMGLLIHQVGDVFSEETAYSNLRGRVQIYLANDTVKEARWLSGLIARIRQNHKDIPSVAIVFRSLDERALLIKDALAWHGILVNDNKGRQLVDVACGQLLLDLLYAIAKQFPKDDVISILSCPVYHASASRKFSITEMLNYFKKAGIRNDVEDEKKPDGAYAHRLLRLKNASSNLNQQEKIQNVIDAVSVLLSIKKIIPKHANLKNYAHGLIKLMDSQVVSNAEGFLKIKEKLLHMESVFEASSGEISLLRFIKWFQKKLSQTILSKSVQPKANVVQLMALPDLWGRQFDYVAVVDMVHGRFPKNFSRDLLLQDSEREEINRLIGRPFLHLSEVNADMETKWWHGALRSARQGLILTSSRQDQSKRDQAQSEYFDAAVRTFGLVNSQASESNILVPFDRLESRISQAKYWRTTGEVSQLDPHEVKTLQLYYKMRKQRDQFFQKEKDAPLLDVTNSFAFKVNKDIFRRRFSSLLGLTSEQPLSYTRIEELARCRFRGFVESMLKVDVRQAAGNDMDTRILGRLAHEVLEFFYKNHKLIERRELNQKDRAQLTAILYKRAQRYLESEASGHQTVLHAYVAWLNTALLRLVSNLARNPPVSDVYPKAFELTVGLNRGEATSFLGAIPIGVGLETLYFGGILDRVDEGEHARVVVDYKISNTASIRRKLDEKQVLHSHFQLPLYLRLLEHHRPTKNSTELLGYLISIADGTVSPLLGRQRVKDLRRRILDDVAPDGLAASLHELLSPVLAGVISADVSERCDECRLKRVCRMSSKPATFPAEVVEEAEGLS
jgi:ATP-dependent helicase/DNAse subunit B